MYRRRYIYTTRVVYTRPNCLTGIFQCRRRLCMSRFPFLSDIPSPIPQYDTRRSLSLHYGKYPTQLIT